VAIAFGIVMGLALIVQLVVGVLTLADAPPNHVSPTGHSFRMS
jgi:hypothetical protein